jgi:ABC-type Fe3+-citrate transport system substrate-binding protein
LYGHLCIAKEMNEMEAKMITLVGIQKDFGVALKDLVELEYDAVEAYEMAIDRLKKREYQEMLSSFLEDHKRHIADVSELLRKHDIEPPTGPSTAKQWIAKGKVFLGNLIGDLEILRAMRSNEIETNVAYERLQNHDNRWIDGERMIARNFQDEQRHKKWLEDTV